MPNTHRIEWTECRDGELFLMVAEKTATAWRFFERSSWEVRWYEVPGSQAHLTMVDRDLAMTVGT